eukprot:14112553-Alexandrium_andersonii.AAC.1
MVCVNSLRSRCRISSQTVQSSKGRSARGMDSLAGFTSVFPTRITCRPRSVTWYVWEVVGAAWMYPMSRRCFTMSGVSARAACPAKKESRDTPSPS